MGDYDNVALVTCAWGLLAYLMMPWGPTAGMTKQNAAQVKFGDRSFMNLIEQAPLFLSSLWTYAFCVSAETASYLGAAYVIFRAFYPIVWLLKGGSTPGYPMPAGFVVTFPAYAIIITMYISTVAKLGFETDLSDPLYAGGGAIALTFVYLGYALMICPILQEKVFKGAFQGAAIMA